MAPRSIVHSVIGFVLSAGLGWVVYDLTGKPVGRRDCYRMTIYSGDTGICFPPSYSRNLAEGYYRKFCESYLTLDNGARRCEKHGQKFVTRDVRKWEVGESAIVCGTTAYFEGSDSMHMVKIEGVADDAVSNSYLDSSSRVRVFPSAQALLNWARGPSYGGLLILGFSLLFCALAIYFRSSGYWGMVLGSFLCGIYFVVPYWPGSVGPKALVDIECPNGFI